MSVGEPAFEARRADWLGPAEAERRVLAGCPLLDVEMVPLEASAGRALAEDVFAGATLPPWDNAAMDGYAARSADLAGAAPTSPAVLRVREIVRAGGRPTHPLGPGEAARIMTGAPVPEGADTVVRVEDTDGESVPGWVAVLHGRDAGRNVRPRGQDLRPGQRILERGHGIHAGTVGVLSAVGCDQVPVHRRPTVAILATGDELRAPGAYGDVVAGVGIPESNGPMLAAGVTAAGGIPRLLGIVPDDAAALAGALERAEESDVLIVVGGASVGEADLVKRALDGAGHRPDFWRVRMRPGSPFGFGHLPRATAEQPVFSLPGNPASAFVTFEVFVRPFLLRMAGHRDIHRRRLRCGAAEPLPGADRALFLRVRLEEGSGGWRARLSGPQGSGLVRGLASAQGLAVVPPGRGAAEGEAVEVILLDPGPAAGPASPLEGLGG